MGADALCLVPGGGFRGKRPRLFLGVAAFGEIPRDLREADERPRRLVAKRGDHDIRPEAGSILAEAPPFVLDATGRGRDLELPRRLARVDVGLGVEGREVPADDLAL